MIVYKATGLMIKPEPVKCKRPGHPNLDANGYTMYVNTHFLTEAEAWRHLQNEREAHLRNAAASVEYAEEELKKAQARLLEAGKLLAKFQEEKARVKK